MLVASFRKVERTKSLEKSNESERTKFYIDNSKLLFRRILEFVKKEENIQKRILEKSIQKGNDGTLQCEHDD